MSNYFDLTKNGIDEISVYQTYAGTNCFVSDKENKTNIYSGFILCDDKQVQTICEVTFFPSGNTGKYIPRLVFRKNIKKTGKTKETTREFVRISFSHSQEGYEQFWKMIAFLYRFKDLVDLGEFDKFYKVVSVDSYISEFHRKRQSQKIQDLIKLFSESELDEESIKQVLAGNRRSTLDDFRKLLEDKEYWNTYQQDNVKELKGIGEEAVWHHFLKKHSWILGLNVDIRFIRDWISEVNAGVPDTNSSGSPKADLLGISDYTVLIELKTPNTDIFTETKKNTARANTWSFSSDFIDGVSQCLGQKFDWDKCHKEKDIVDNNGKVINQDSIRTIDTKTIFLIGNKAKELPEDSTKVDIFTKRDTFQRFRRNNRNLEIITFDELYERAYYIVHNKKPSPLSFEDNIDDVPF